jgi:hypothetical protein
VEAVPAACARARISLGNEAEASLTALVSGNNVIPRLSV